MTTLAHAFDIESTGPKIGPGRLMSIGACCLEIPRHGPVEVIDSFFAVIEWPEGLVYDDEKTKRFWDQHPEAHAQSTTGGGDPEAVAASLKEHISRVQYIAGKRKTKYVVVTDNAYFDVPWIDWFLCTYTQDGLPLRHNYHTGWMSGECMCDVNERARALRDVGVSINLKAFHSNVPHDHHPLHDATRLAEMYAYYKRMTRSIKTSK